MSIFFINLESTLRNDFLKNFKIKYISNNIKFKKFYKMTSNFNIFDNIFNIKIL